MMAPIAISPWPCVSSLDALLIWLNSGVCSQNPAHSFWIDGRPLPLCARDLGLFGGFLLASLFVGRRQLWWLLGLAPLLVDGANSFAYDTVGLWIYAPTNLLRLVTGVLGGVGLARVCHSEPQAKNLLVSTRRGRSFALLRMTCGTLPMLVLATLSPYFALALLATAGVLAMLAATNKLMRPDARLAWALALPELALLATAKQGLLAVLA